ncbi:MAG: hypothetical protein NT075_28730, partial [Chloroflexi bacterium]|nr:hypothetical protein [Chloroflexota bacterium]
AFASLLIIIFQGSVSRLIPLYAIGVFLCFTMSQSGMAKRWLRIGKLMKTGELTTSNEIPTMGSVLHYDRHWNYKMLLNGFGALVTAIVTVIFLVTKFTSGAWIIVILIPSLLLLFMRIHRHYKDVAHILSTAGQHITQRQRRLETIVLVGDVHRETLRLVEFANSLGVPWTPVHIAVHEERVEDIKRKWCERVGIGELVVVASPYRSLTRPLRAYVEKRLRNNPGGFIQVVVGQLRTGNPMSQILHQNAHFIEQLALGDIDGVVTTVVPLHLEKFKDETAEVAAEVAATVKPVKGA